VTHSTQHQSGIITLDREAVFLKLAGIIEDDDLTKYVL